MIIFRTNRFLIGEKNCIGSREASEAASRSPTLYEPYAIFERAGSCAVRYVRILQCSRKCENPERDTRPECGRSASDERFRWVNRQSNGNQSERLEPLDLFLLIPTYSKDRRPWRSLEKWRIFITKRGEIQSGGMWIWVHQSGSESGGGRGDDESNVNRTTGPPGTNRVYIVCVWEMIKWADHESQWADKNGWLVMAIRMSCVVEVIAKWSLYAENVVGCFVLSHKLCDTKTSWIRSLVCSILVEEGLGGRRVQNR